MKKLILISIFLNICCLEAMQAPKIYAPKGPGLVARATAPSAITPATEKPTTIIAPKESITLQQQAKSPDLIQQAATLAKIPPAVPPSLIPRGQGPLMPQTVQSLINGGCNPSLSKFMGGPKFDEFGEYQNNIDSLTKFATDLGEAIKPTGIQQWSDDLQKLQDILNAIQKKQTDYNNKNAILKQCTQNCEKQLSDNIATLNSLLDSEADLMTLFAKYGYSYLPIRLLSPIQMGGVNLSYQGKELAINNILNIDDTIISQSNISNFVYLLQGALQTCGNKINIIKSKIDETVDKVKQQALGEGIASAVVAAAAQLPVWMALGGFGNILMAESILEMIKGIRIQGLAQINDVINDIFSTIANMVVENLLEDINGVQEGVANFLKNPAGGLLQITSSSADIYFTATNTALTAGVQTALALNPIGGLIVTTYAVTNSALYKSLEKIPVVGKAFSWVGDQVNDVVHALNPSNW